MQGAKGIHPARVDPAVEFGPLLGEEPAVGDIRLRARQVDHAVRRVVVADHEHRAPAPQRLRSGEDRPREVELVADPAVVPGRAASLGEVAVDHHEPPAGGLEVRGHEPPLSVESRHAQGGVHPDGLELRVEADTAIAPALGDRERGVPARWAAGGMSSGRARTSWTSTISAPDRSTKSTNPCRTPARIPLTFQLTTRIRSASEWSVIVSTGRLRHTHRWSAASRCQNRGDGVRFRASH